VLEHHSAGRRAFIGVRHYPSLVILAQYCVVMAHRYPLHEDRHLSEEIAAPRKFVMLERSTRICICVVMRPIKWRRAISDELTKLKNLGTRIVNSSQTQLFQKIFIYSLRRNPHFLGALDWYQL
jgi:hypothetical protein